MKCFDPVLCYTTPKGKKLYRHFSHANEDIKKLHQKRFNCGKCLICRKKKSYELAARCVLHASLYKDNCFITLTYDEKKEGYHNELQYEDIQKFKKRLRSYCHRKFNKKIQVFNVHEYGTNGKKHWHLIVFNHNFSDKQPYFKTKSGTLYISNQLQKLWTYGHHTIGDVSLASAMYQAQYMEKDIKNNYCTSKKKSKSNHSGLGKDFFFKNYKQILELGYVPFDGKKLPIPRYFEKLAKKHYCHFYDKGEFFDSPITGRKRQFRPFTKEEQPDITLANLYSFYKATKEEKIKELEEQWQDIVEKHLTTNQIPDFIKSAENIKHDFLNKNQKSKF
nr:MAG: replication initiator protein [Microvirus sp.]